MITPDAPQGQTTVNLYFQLIIASLRKAATQTPFHAEHLQAISDKIGYAVTWLIRIRELTAGRTHPCPYHSLFLLCTAQGVCGNEGDEVGEVEQERFSAQEMKVGQVSRVKCEILLSLIWKGKL